MVHYSGMHTATKVVFGILALLFIWWGASFLIGFLAMVLHWVLIAGVVAAVGYAIYSIAAPRNKALYSRKRMLP